jgi:beta-glucosidase
VQAIIERVIAKCPNTKVILHPIFPRGLPDSAARGRNAIVNHALSLTAKSAWKGKVLWCNFNGRLQDEKGALSKEMFPDSLHPAASGYEI